MPEQKQQDPGSSKQVNAQPAELPNVNIPVAAQPISKQPVINVSSTPNENGQFQHGYKAKLNVSDAEADAILQLNGPTINSMPKSSPPIKLLIAALVLITLAVVASYLIGAYSPSKSSAKTSSGGIGLPTQGNPSSTHGVTNQINKDVKTCSNPLNATLVC